MEAFLAGIRYDQIGFGAIVVFGVLAVLRGWIVPRSTVVDLRTDRKERLDEIASERDDWKQAYLVSEQARMLLVSQNGELLELAKTANHILSALPSTGEAKT